MGRSGVLTSGTSKFRWKDSRGRLCVSYFLSSPVWRTRVFFPCIFLETRASLLPEETNGLQCWTITLNYTVVGKRMMWHVCMCMCVLYLVDFMRPQECEIWASQLGIFSTFVTHSDFFTFHISLRVLAMHTVPLFKPSTCSALQSSRPSIKRGVGKRPFGEQTALEYLFCTTS